MPSETKCEHMVSTVLVIIIFLFFASNPPVSVPEEIYHWKDKEGNSHFTDDLGKVPKGTRDRLEVVPMPTPRASPEPPPIPQPEEPEDVDSKDASDMDATKPFEEEVSKWQKTLEEHTASLEDLNRAIHRTHTAWKRNQLQKERVKLEGQILEDKKMLEETLPARGRELGIERYW